MKLIDTLLFGYPFNSKLQMRRMPLKKALVLNCANSTKPQNLNNEHPISACMKLIDTLLFGYPFTANYKCGVCL